MSPLRKSKAAATTVAPKPAGKPPKVQNQRTGKDRRAGTDRRVAQEPIAEERRSGIDRRTGVDRRQRRGFDALLRKRLILIGGALLSYPAVRTYLDGSLAADAMAIRIAVAFGFAALAVNMLNLLLVAYAPKAEPPKRIDTSIEDADTVDDGGEAPGG
jgi:hypothetical protein